MERVIIKKENGVVTKSIRTSQLSNKANLINNEKCFKNIINYDNNYTKEDFAKAKKLIYTMMKEINQSGYGQTIINKLFEILKVASSKEDLMDILKYINEAYTQIIITKKTPKNGPYIDIRDRINFDNMLENHFDIIISIAIKKIVLSYYLKTILNLGKDKINKLEREKVNGKDISEMLLEIGETFSNEDKNGIKNLSLMVFSDLIDITFDQMQVHLCWENCKNATVGNCRKILEGIEHNIEEYDFITDGYQLCKPGTEKINKFIVSNCLNYEEEKRKPLTFAQKEEIKKIKDSIKTTYFNTETIEEAHLIQDELINSKRIRNIRGSRPNQEYIKRLKIKKELDYLKNHNK